MSYGNCTNFNALFVWLLCVLVVVIAMTSAVAAQRTTPSSQLFSGGSVSLARTDNIMVTVREGAPPIGQGTIIRSQVPAMRLADVTQADAPAIVLSKVSQSSSFDRALSSGRLARYSH